MPRRGVHDEAARLYLRLAYTLDRRSRKRDGTRLVPWDLDPLSLPAFGSWREIDEALDRLRRWTNRLPRSFRRDWLRDHLPTLRALADVVRGRVPPLEAQMRDFYGLPPRTAKESQLDELREEVRSILGVSRGGDLRAAVDEWEGHHLVGRAEALRRMQVFLAEARRDSRRLFELPSSEGCRLVAVRSNRFACYCLHRGGYQSVLNLNVGIPWTWPALRDMATHEAYPGHHVLQATREWEYLHGDFPREAAVSLAVDPMGPVEEGIGECAMPFLGWDHTPEDRMTIALERLRWGTELNLAWMISREEPRREVVRYAVHSGLVDWDRALRDVRYASHRAWGAYGACYWFGAQLVERQWRRLDGDSAFFDVIYWKPYTVRTLGNAFRRV